MTLNITNPKKRRNKSNENDRINRLVKHEASLHNILEGKEGVPPLTEDKRQEIVHILKNLQKYKESLKGKRNAS